MRPVPDLEAAFADHDRLFKELLTVFFLDFVELFLPDLAARIDAESVEFLNQELFSDLNEGARRIVDLLVRVRLRDPANTEAFILIHVENQSKVEARFARRMFLITARLDENTICRSTPSPFSPSTRRVVRKVTDTKFRRQGEPSELRV